MRPRVLTPTYRALFVFHHLLATKKKKAIRAMTKDLALAGICKTGYPGVAAVFGTEPDVRQFIKTVKSWPWQTCELRSCEPVPEILETIANSSSEQSFEMVEKLSSVGEWMHRYGFTEWFRASMGFK
ncbi:hypothetical protein C8J56DRAFT_802939 [Mycena floridula]|nr:hypothetical protein C8J56DRAFT_802939 [Mycena floridula]